MSGRRLISVPCHFFVWMRFDACRNLACRCSRALLNVLNGIFIFLWRVILVPIPRVMFFEVGYQSLQRRLRDALGGVLADTHRLGEFLNATKVSRYKISSRPFDYQVKEVWVLLANSFKVLDR